ncbi:MAG: nucleotidyltransferase domain-containing protein [Candidatus Omnitrophica bacterium]|nr:nucleotidyltransferase domain-containing protein [Candidatus Omnitrophota bacterium]MBU0896847.1 nucleotidyltransferase domain-containing protein [Candidatus Omnitrophota bacterium]MBU1134165.1 nucleotidyltransferase domain-containing protein [Candidatus Omnitrophota bacterium]MBU1810913.1 nucleotidyltransferase domain-containing protein [Candidatus Omnitrophota bacterium]
MQNVVVTTNSQKALNFLIQNPGKQWTANEVQKGIKISKAGINVALRKLVKEKLVFREKRAKIFLYFVDHSNPVIKQLKVLQTIMILQPLIVKIKGCSEKTVLFGSCARGENLPDSDVDLFVLTNAKEEIKRYLGKFSLRKKLQPIIRSPLQFSEMETKEPVFFEEIVRGITLWETKA